MGRLGSRVAVCGGRDLLGVLWGGACVGPVGEDCRRAKGKGGGLKGGLVTGVAAAAAACGAAVYKVARVGGDSVWMGGCGGGILSGVVRANGSCSGGKWDPKANGEEIATG